MTLHSISSHSELLYYFLEAINPLSQHTLPDHHQIYLDCHIITVIETITALTKSITANCRYVTLLQLFHHYSYFGIRHREFFGQGPLQSFWPCTIAVISAIGHGSHFGLALLEVIAVISAMRPHRLEAFSPDKETLIFVLGAEGMQCPMGYIFCEGILRRDGSGREGRKGR